ETFAEAKQLTAAGPTRGIHAPHQPARSSKKFLRTKASRNMQKPAPIDSPIHQLLRDRWSPRSFADKAIPDYVLRSLFEAARWAPSSNNEQPWAYIVATKDDKANFEKALSTLVEFNAGWAKSASALAIAVSELAFAKSHAPNRNALYDTGAATAFLSV